MSALLVLCRHGNTFESGETPIMIGARQDLPLTAEGIAQAQRAGAALMQANIVNTHSGIGALICGPLQRTHRYAAEICRVVTARGYISSDVRDDHRLCELDYGTWSGCTNDQLLATFGAEEFAAWNERGVWPCSGAFTPPYAQVLEETKSLLQEAVDRDDLTVAVTSNGRVRVFGELCSGADGDYKMRTGHISLLAYEDGGWRILHWNLDPAQLTTPLY